MFEVTSISGWPVFIIAVFAVVYPFLVGWIAHKSGKSSEGWFGIGLISTLILGFIAQLTVFSTKQTVETYAEVVEIQDSNFASRTQVSEDQFFEYVADFFGAEHATSDSEVRDFLLDSKDNTTTVQLTFSDDTVQNIRITGDKDLQQLRFENLDAPADNVLM